MGCDRAINPPALAHDHLGAVLVCGGSSYEHEDLHAVNHQGYLLFGIFAKLVQRDRDPPIPCHEG